MTPLEVDFLRRLVARRPESRPSGLTAQSLSNSEHIGTVRLNKVIYNSNDFERAVNLLSSRGIAVDVPALPYSRSGAPAGLSEKHGSQPVSAGLIAIRGMHMLGLLVPRNSFVAVKATDALTMDYEVLMVVENLEALMRIEEYGWLENYVKGRPTLAIFRGAPGWFKLDAAMQFISRDHHPTLAFFDFDPKGLAMAASLPRREALCLPDLHVLEATTLYQSRRHLYHQSADVSEHQLSAEKDPAIHAAWLLLQRLAMGLDQEHFPTE